MIALGLAQPRMLLALAMLFGATVLDLRTRRVANLYWYPFLAFALILDVTGLASTGDWLGPAVALAFCGVFYVFWRFRLFGGADAKGLMVLALLLPPTTGALTIPTVLGALLIGSLLAGVGLPVAFLAWNLAHARFRLPAALVGVPMGLAAARRSHVWPMQEPRPDGTLGWRYMRHVGSDVEARFDALAAAGVTRPWVTPKVPFMLPLLLGVAAWPTVVAVFPWPVA